MRVVAVNKAGRSSGPGDSAPIRVVAAQDPTNIIGGTVVHATFKPLPLDFSVV